MRPPRRLDLWLALAAPVLVPLAGGLLCTLINAVVISGTDPNHVHSQVQPVLDFALGTLCFTPILLPLYVSYFRKVRRRVDEGRMAYDALRFPDLAAIADRLAAESAASDRGDLWSGIVDGLQVTLRDRGDKTLVVRVETGAATALRFRSTLAGASHWTGDAAFDSAFAVESRSEDVYVALGRAVRAAALELAVPKGSIAANHIAGPSIAVEDGVVEASVPPVPDDEAAAIVRGCVSLANLLRSSDAVGRLADSARHDPSARFRLGALSCLVLSYPGDRETQATCEIALGDADASIRALAALALPEKRGSFLDLTPAPVLVDLATRGLPVALLAFLEVLGRCGAPAGTHLAALRDAPAVASAKLVERAKQLAAGTAGDLSLAPAQGGELSESTGPGALALVSKAKPTPH